MMIGKTNGGGKDRLRPTIYGGTTRPSNPKNGDFYVYTGTAISGTELNGFISGFPTWTMPEGFVYIGSGGTYNDSIFVNLINVRNGMHNFCPCCCYQVEGGKWYRKDAFVYRNGAWLKFSTWAQQWDGTLFYNGNQYEDVTGGWVGNGISSTTVGTNLSLIVANTSPYLTTQNAIDLSGYTKLHMIADGNAGQYSYFGISSNVPSNARPNYIASATFIGGENVLDVSAINSGHISIGATASWGVTINISKVWLE